MAKLVISLVTVLFFAGGYFYFVPGSSDASFTQYLPNSLTSFFKEDEMVELSVDQSDLDPIEEVVSQPVETYKTQKDFVRKELDENVEPAATSTDSSVEGSVEVATDLIPEALRTAEEKMANGASNDVPTKTIIEPIISSDLIKLENELVEMNTSIIDIDSENEKLQQKFKEMLKKNKDLAVTLGRLEKELETTN